MKNRVILAVTNDLSGDQRVHKVAMSLIKFGYQPTLVGRVLPGSIPVQRPYGIRRFRLLFHKGPLFYCAYNIRLFFYLLFVRADIFLANDLDTLSAAYLAGRLRKKKIVYDSHEYFTEVPELVTRKGVKKVWLFIEKAIFPELKNVYTVNDSIAEIYKNKYGVPVNVVRNVPSAQLPAPVAGQLPVGFTDSKVILYQGALNVGRGLEEMIRALPMIPDCHFLLVGDGDIRPELEALVKEMNLDKRVCFTGRLPFDQVSWYTMQATIGISLEQDMGLSYHYALPNKLFNYLQLGLPVIASDLPEIRQIVERVGFGLIIDRFDPEYLSEQIRSILNDPELLRNWHDRALAVAPDYTWEAEEKVLLSIFPEL